MRQITININNDNDFIKLTKDIDGVKETKYISSDDLLNILELSLLSKKDKLEKLNEVKYDTSFMPSSNGVSIVNIKEYHSGDKKVILKKDACKHDFPVYENIFEKVGLPTLIFILRIKNNQIYSGSCFATKTNFITEDTEVFRYPFPNVGYNGGICFGGGNSKNLKIENLYDLHSFPNKFIMMPTTHELATNYNSKIPLRTFLENLQNNDFPLDELISFNKTIKEIL